MLIGTDFVKAHHEYRGEVMRKAYEARPSGKIGKAVAALVVAGVAAMVSVGL